MFNILLLKLDLHSCYYIFHNISYTPENILSANLSSKLLFPTPTKNKEEIQCNFKSTSFIFMNKQYLDQVLLNILLKS